MLLTLLLLCLPWIQETKASNPEISKWLELPENKRVDNAYDLFSGLLSSDPRLVISLVNQVLPQTSSENEKKILEVYKGLAFVNLNEPEKALPILTFCEPFLSEMMAKKSGHSESIWFIKIYADCLLTLATNNQSLGRMDAARVQFNKAISIIKETDDDMLLLKVSYYKTVFHITLGEHEPALDLSIRSYKLAKKLKDSFWQQNNAFHLGYIYRLLEDYPVAIEWYEEVLALTSAPQMLSHRIRALNEIGNIEMLKHDYDAALKTKAKALELLGPEVDVATRGSCLADYGLVLWTAGRISESEDYLLQAKALFEDNGNNREVIICLHNLIGIQLDLGKLAEGEASGKQALELAIQNQMNAETVSIRKSLANLLQQAGKDAEAYELLLAADMDEENLLQEENQQRIAELKTQFETELKTQKIKLLERDKKIQDLSLNRQHLIRNVLFTGLGILLLFLALLGLGYREKTQAHNMIASKNNDLNEAYRKLDLTARVDPLTGLHNRRELMLRFEEEKHRTERKKGSLAVVLTDVDNFKYVNDTRGHDCGDMVLCDVATLIREVVRKQDCVGRWGGEEFLLLLPDTEIIGAVELAEKIRVRLENHLFRYDSQEFHITMTLGVSTSKLNEGLQETVKRADQALYNGKRNGKNRVESDDDARIS